MPYPASFHVVTNGRPSLPYTHTKAGPAPPCSAHPAVSSLSNSSRGESGSAPCQASRVEW
ncbi:hypothetical protein E2C01_048171 [Portunus trituberculatus]|uniref:Uncharacterized protein n=1 Tax=Portunus trituberculatus TaxID=210409 RepID=A0A5B7G2Z5_PORTR|nr:hypothetical protein [Portunus trituberculatus]